MAIDIDKRTLKMSLIIGDTGTFAFNLTSDEVFELGEGDKIVFTLKKTKDSDPIIQKTITEFEDGWVIVPLLPSDTANMEKATYIYDLKLIRADGNVDTLLPNNKESAPFILKRGVKDANN